MRSACLAVLIVLSHSLFAIHLPGLALEFDAGPLVGLERMFRGCAVEATLSASSDGFGPLAVLELSWDQTLGTLIAAGELGFSLGPGLRVFAGAELPLGELVADSGGGALIALEPATWPCRFGISTLIAEGPLQKGSLALWAEVSYAAYRVLEVRAREGGEAPALEEVLAGIAGFSLGFRAQLRLKYLLPLSP